MSLEQSSSQQTISCSREKVQTEVKEREKLCLRVWTQGIVCRINESGKTEVAGWLEQAQTGLEGNVVVDLTPGDCSTEGQSMVRLLLQSEGPSEGLDFHAVQEMKTEGQRRMS